jgi:hypothetical protein
LATRVSVYNGATGKNLFTTVIDGAALVRVEVVADEPKDKMTSANEPVVATQVTAIA